MEHFEISGNSQGQEPSVSVTASNSSTTNTFSTGTGVLSLSLSSSGNSNDVSPLSSTVRTPTSDENQNPTVSSSSSDNDQYMTPEGGQSPVSNSFDDLRQDRNTASVAVTVQGSVFDTEPEFVPTSSENQNQSRSLSVDIDNFEIDIDLNASNSSSSGHGSSLNLDDSNPVITSSNRNNNRNEIENLNSNPATTAPTPNQANNIQESSSRAEPEPVEAIVGNRDPNVNVNVNDNGNGIDIADPFAVDPDPEEPEAVPEAAQLAQVDEHAEEFRRRFFQAILRRGGQGQPVEAPPEYEEYDEDDNIDLIEEIVDGDEDSYDGISTGPPSSRDDRDRELDSDGPIENREEVSSVPVFDLQLPTRHSYLGDGMEALSGRTILEGGAITEIPLVLLEFHLVPGQTLPLTVFHATTQSALRNCVPNNRHFGIVHSGLNDVNIRAPLPRRALGTTAEIYEFQEERDRSRSHRHRLLQPSVNIKAKGRHRFNVLSTYRQSDGHLMAKVRIRPEINLSKPWRNIVSNSHRHLFPALGHPTRVRTGSGVGTRSSQSLLKRLIKFQSTNHHKDKDNVKDNVKDKGTSPFPPIQPKPSQPVPDIEAPTTSSAIKANDGLGFGFGSGFEVKSQTPLTEVNRRLEENRRKTKYYSALTGWPYFVYEQFDDEILVEKIHRKLESDLSSLVAASVVVPREASDLSYWLAQNLTMSDELRLKILKMDTPLERLSFANKLLDKVSRLVECNQCQGVIANHADIFSMSVEGPQGTYVNPQGFVHELITVTKIRGIIYRGYPSTEASWFPGYSWRIMECRTCRNHIGWKFEAVKKLKPTKFWGVARRSVSFKYDFSIDNDCPDLNAPPPEESQPQFPISSSARSRTNSVPNNSSGNATSDTGLSTASSHSHDNDNPNEDQGAEMI